MNIIKSTVFGLSMAFFAIAMVVSTPVAHAQWDGSGFDSGTFDGGGCCSVDAGVTDFGGGVYSPDFGGGVYSPDYGGGVYSPDQGYAPGGYTQGGYSSPGYYGGSSSYSSPSYYSSTPSYSSNYAPYHSSTYAPTTSSTFAPYTSSVYSPYTHTVRDNGNSCITPGSCSTDSHNDNHTTTTTRDNGNTSTCTNPYSCSTTTTTSVHDNNNTIDSNNSCVQPGSCSTTTTTTDSHNTTISSPTTINSPINITSSNPPASQTQIIYNNPAPQPVSYSYTSPTPTPYVAQQQQIVGGVAQQQQYVGAVAQQQVVYRAPRPTVPYVTLSQVPYTGLELGPAGLVMYWSFLVLWCLFMAYLIVVKQMHIKLAHTLKSVVFGDEIDTAPATPADESVEVTDQYRTLSVYSAPEVKKVDAIDDFILTQIHRA